MLNFRNMKVWTALVCIATALAAPANQPYSNQRPLQMDMIDMVAISRMSPKQLESLAEGLAAAEIMRTKRSSAQALSLVSKASSGIQSKVNLLGKASAGVTNFIAAASSKSGHGDEHPGYNYEVHEPKVDFWGLKKSILYTLFQAVKAITGGVTILKGQLIKGGGALASTVGKVISVKGEAVSNLGKKIVSSAALSHKAAPPVYGPPASHLEYAPTGYGAPTAPAHLSYAGPSAPTGYASHKYPVHLDGRGKLNGAHAGLVILTPIEEGTLSNVHHEPTHVGHTPLEPPPSIIHTAFNAIKNVFSSVAPSYVAEETDISNHPPPPPQPVPPFQPMSWGAIDSYGEPALPDSYSDYDPRSPHRPFDYASSKLSVVPSTKQSYGHSGLNADKLQKIQHNLKKVEIAMNGNINQRSSEISEYNGMAAINEILKNGKLMLPTPVVSDNEIGVYPADILPSDPKPVNTTFTTTMTTTPSTTTTLTTTTENKQRRKDVKYILRGNRIVQI